jgi:LDH2 family malate/lactate/ureidoglycolate dehydrogenase
VTDKAYDPAVLQHFATDIFTSAGLTDDDAEATARGIVTANVLGVDSHGVARLPQYTQCLTAGEVNRHPQITVHQVGAAVTHVDADGGYGYRPSYRAIEACMQHAQDAGIGLAGVSRSHHFGMASTYTRLAAERGFVAYAATNASPKLTPPGGIQPVVGNNPLSWGIPRRPGTSPIVLDMALSTVAFGKIRLARMEKRAIPIGWGLDRHGQPTTDAQEAFDSGLLSAIGGYKGYGLSIVAEALAGILTGSPFGKHGAPHSNGQGGVGHLFVVFRPDLFVTKDRFFDDVDELARQIHGAEMGTEGGRALLPGEIEDDNSRRRSESGVPLSAALQAELDSLAASMNVELLTARAR